MKTFIKKILTHRKIVIIYIFALLLPSLTIGYLSLSTFSKRRETVEKFFESNLLISGESAVKKIEDGLLDYEKAILTTKTFISLIKPQSGFEPSLRTITFSEKFPGQLFLLNSEFKIIFPRIGGKINLTDQLPNEFSEPVIKKLYTKGEYYEFSQQNYTKASEAYRKCLTNISSPQLRARVLGALGRSLYANKRFHEARNIFQELIDNYKRFLNQAGHPYGIISTLQIAKIYFSMEKKDTALKLLFDLYKEIYEGNWRLNSTVYNFFVTEIKTTLNKILNEKSYPELNKLYLDLHSFSSPYLEALLFGDLLKKKVIPALGNRLELALDDKDSNIERFLSIFKEKTGLISYIVLPDFQNGETYYGGFYLDTRLIKNKFFPILWKKISVETGLEFSLTNDMNPQSFEEDNLSGKGYNFFYFHKFPFNWKLKVFHPDIKNLKKESQKEIIIFGLLLSVIFIFMLLGAFLIARDISRESETTRLKTEFVHNISHEFKTPLTLIRLYGETLKRKEKMSEKEKLDSYEIITKESERLSHLIDNVLDFSRIEMDRKEFNFQKGNLSKTIEETLESYRYHLEKKEFTINKTITPDLEGIVFDSEAVTSVLINLLSNAMKFSTSTKEVTVRLFRRYNQAVLQVIDKGIGISSSDQKKIFQRFYRASDKVVSEISGSGLGLPLIKHIITAHKGKIKVQSNPGKGSIFSVFLPFSENQEGKSEEKYSNN